MKIGTLENRSVKTILIAAVVAACVAIAGLGTALAAPDCDHENLISGYDEEYPYTVSETVNLYPVRSDSGEDIDAKTLYRRLGTYWFKCDDCGTSVYRDTFIKFKEDVVVGNCTNNGKGTALFDIYVDKTGAIKSEIDSLTGYVNDAQKSDVVSANADKLEYIMTTQLSYNTNSNHKKDLSTKRVIETREGYFYNDLEYYYVEGYGVVNPGEKYAYDCSVCGQEQVDYNFTWTAYPTSIQYIWNDGEKVVVKNGMNAETYNHKESYWNSDYSQYSCTVEVTFSDGSKVSYQNPILDSLDPIEHDGWSEDPFEWYDTSNWRFTKITAPLYYYNQYGESRCHTSWIYMYKTGDKVYGATNLTLDKVDEFEEAVDNGDWGEDPEEPVIPDNPDDPDKVSGSFSIKFKATGIQSTGFNDYKEAMTVLNGLTH